ncbi:hypothetical protein NMQ03_06780 [Arthrobacter sp. DNA4]|uniref:hypothetical protein n=1 Tax=Arthrobacter sp. DNA4 TaxID=2963432 RepID=UPI0020CEF799|nr:hypothetical protein [Arthrobacter sp. DNA4]UTT70819.1 hypothetical protein NMQ03_06780 [Arthrobacter sp. DNA4]
MTGASYIPGTWLGIVRSGTAVLLGPETPAGLAGAIWELLASQPEPHEVLAAVTSSSGGSLTRIPSFGILDFNGSLRVFLRGDLDLSVEQPGGPVELDGRDVTTWNERRFVVPGTCRLGVAGGATAGQAAGRPGQPLNERPLREQPLPELPLGEGVVLLQTLTLCAPAGPAAVGGPAAVDREESPVTPASVDGPFAVSSSGEVDGPAGFGPPLAPEPAPGTAAADDGEAADESQGRPDTFTPAESGVDVRESADMPDPVPAAHHVDPEATIAPGSIMDADGELFEETGAGDSTGDGAPGAESPNTESPATAGPGSAAAGAEPTTAAASHGDAGPAVELTTSYDHLWDRTVMRNIEDAAVREDLDADSGHVVPQQQPALPAAEPLPALGTGEDAAPGGSSAESGAGLAGAADSGPSDARSDAPAGPGAGSNGAAATPSRPASSGVLIDSVPWRTAGTAPAATAPGIGSDAPAREPAPFQGLPAAYEPGPAAFGRPRSMSCLPMGSQSIPRRPTTHRSTSRIQARNPAASIPTMMVRRS